ncbi:MAG: DUF882 domain-containing protein [Clostridia bacterium]|nr:DUF882 domain-containing protein [Clostridia bacterium]
MSIKAYSLKKQKNEHLSKNFTIEEFACRDGSDKILIDTKLVELLQKIRNHFGLPVTITSAYRTESYNIQIGGVAGSTHTKGIAADIFITEITPNEIAAYIEYIMPDYGGIGLYSNFVHIDVRSNRSRWKNYGSEIVVDGFYGYNPVDKTIQNPADAIDVLSDKAIINSPEIWYNGTWTGNDFKHLLIKFANYVLQGKNNDM